MAGELVVEKDMAKVKSIAKHLLSQKKQQMWQMFLSTNHTNFFKEQCDDDITSNKLSYHHAPCKVTHINLHPLF